MCSELDFPECLRTSTFSYSAFLKEQNLILMPFLLISQDLIPLSPGWVSVTRVNGETDIFWSKSSHHVLYIPQVPLSERWAMYHIAQKLPWPPRRGLSSRCWKVGIKGPSDEELRALGLICGSWSWESCGWGEGEHSRSGARFLGFMVWTYIQDSDTGTDAYSKTEDSQDAAPRQKSKTRTTCSTSLWSQRLLWRASSTPSRSHGALLTQPDRQRGRARTLKSHRLIIILMA